MTFDPATSRLANARRNSGCWDEARALVGTLHGTRRLVELVTATRSPHFLAECAAGHVARVDVYYVLRGDDARGCRACGAGHAAQSHVPSDAWDRCPAGCGALVWRSSQRRDGTTREPHSCERELMRPAFVGETWRAG